MNTIQDNVQSITANMSRDELIKEINQLAEAFTDLTDGYNSGDLMGHGLSEERADEIVNLSDKYLQG